MDCTEQSVNSIQKKKVTIIKQINYRQRVPVWLFQFLSVDAFHLAHDDPFLINSRMHRNLCHNEYPICLNCAAAQHPMYLHPISNL